MSKRFIIKYFIVQQNITINTIVSYLNKTNVISGIFYTLYEIHELITS